MKVKELPVNERPREKFLKYGKENMSDAELLAIVLKSGTHNLNSVELACNILNEIDNLNGLKDISYDDLIKIKGIGNAKATTLLAILELSKRIYYKLDNVNNEFYDTPEKIYLGNKYLFDNVKQERFYCLYLDSKKMLIERKLLFMGTVNKSVVHPREIFKEAYRISASSIVCMHNHPSGDITPSYEDINLTNSLTEIGRINGIPVVDHIIFGDDKYYSFYENNRRIKKL